MLKKITELRNKAFKDGDKLARNAYNSFITSCQTSKGRGEELTEKKLLKILKKEISKYKEMVKKDYEVELLSNLLPEEKPQLSEEKIRKLINSYEGQKNPGLVMKWLDSQGYENLYNKGLVAKIVLNR